MESLRENDVRAWLRAVWDSGNKSAPINWIEPATGSSMGLPDVLLPVFYSLIPIELKTAKKTRKGFLSIVRPVQCRFHLTMKAHKLFSCFLVGYGDKENFEVWLSHNSFAFAEYNENPGELLVANNQSIQAPITKNQLINAIEKLMKKHKQFLILE